MARLEPGFRGGAMNQKGRAGVVAAAPASSSGCDWALCACGRDQLIRRVSQQGARHFRELPWRFIEDPYAVLVSEVMLQQTQVKRVLGYWGRWLELFPTVDAVAAADTAAVLEAWQGLGYNRRALALKRCCETCARDYAGALPRDEAALQALPGIGAATAAGVRAFAFNEPAAYLETNVRSVFLHELFPDGEGVADKQLLAYVGDACCAAVCQGAADARTWNYWLLDYGAHLKAEGINPSRRSKHYKRQSAFEGSRRQKRSILLKCVLAAPQGIDCAEAAVVLNRAEAEAGLESSGAEAVRSLIDELVAEGFFRQEGDLLIP